MRVSLSLALILAASSLSAQVHQLRRSGLPRDVADRLEAAVADPAARHIRGSATIGADEVIEGDVVATGGVLRLAGVIRGQLIVIDGSVVFESGAEVAGDVTVVGGSASGTEAVRFGGTFTEYSEGFGWVDGARRLHDGRDRMDDVDRRWRDDLGHVDMAVRVGQNYNRVEGLPLQFGPSIRTGGPSPTQLQAFAIWRTTVGSLRQTDRMGYLARAEQFIGPHFRVGVGAHSVVQPLDPWGVTDLEASLAAALFHEDQRDYFDREGWSAWLRLAPRRSPFDVTVEYRDERHATAPVRDPWALFDGDGIWRLQPVAAEGRIRSIGTTIEFDSRPDRGFVADGWLLRIDAVHGLESELATPALLLGGQTAAPSRDFGGAFTTGTVDLRRFEPVGYNGALGLRVVAGGVFADAALPPQFQHALGGAGTLPGYGLLSVDCGARSSLGAIQTGIGGAGQSYYGGYGCDRFGLVQAEYRGGFDVSFGDDHERDDRRDRWPGHVHASVDWTVFMDAARGWRFAGDGTRLDTGMLYDAGVGVVLGDVGVYGAVPLTGTDRGLRMFIRLGPRF